MADIVQPPKTSRYQAEIKRHNAEIGTTDSRGYVNAWDVWTKFPTNPRWLSFNGSSFAGSVGWWIYEPADDDEKRGSRGKRKGRSFKTFAEAVAYGRKHLGIKGWEYVKIGRYGDWFPNDDWEGVLACEETIHGDGYGGGMNKCGRPVVGEGWGYWQSSGIVPLCSIHMGVHKRKEANAAKRAEENAIRQAKADEKARERKVAEDAVARLRGWGLKAVVGRPTEGTGYDPLLNGEMIVALVERFELACRELGLDFDEEIAELTKGGRV